MPESSSSERLLEIIGTQNETAAAPLDVQAVMELVLWRASSPAVPAQADRHHRCLETAPSLRVGLRWHPADMPHPELSDPDSIMVASATSVER